MLHRGGPRRVRNRCRPGGARRRGPQRPHVLAAIDGANGSAARGCRARVAGPLQHDGRDRGVWRGAARHYRKPLNQGIDHASLRYAITPVTCTRLPESVIEAPWPLSITIPASVIEMCAPAIFSVMPPLGPATSDISSERPPVVT